MIEYVCDFDELSSAPLKVDAVYPGGSYGNVKDDPICRLLPGVGNQGGFRQASRKDDKSKFAYVVIYTSNEELEWPDYLDTETGIFRYYGDNRKPGAEIHDTRHRGNALLCDVFEALHAGRQEEIPPFFIFQRAGKARDVRFLGLAVPGSQRISSDRDLVAFWRTMDQRRFQNYEAYFTVLDLGGESVDRRWLEALVQDNGHSLGYAPSCWKEFVSKGRDGIRALQAPRIQKIPSKQAQLPADAAGEEILSKLVGFYEHDPYSFEPCACKIVQMMDENFAEFDLTRPWRDGGRDALGRYRIGPAEHPLTVECALEAKCHVPSSSVGVREMSRLISRIKYRQFGILVTTSYVNPQAYREVVEDGHPILIITGRDIARILVNNGISGATINEWLGGIVVPDR